MAELYATPFRGCNVNENIVAAVVRLDKFEAFVRIKHLQNAVAISPPRQPRSDCNRKPAAERGDELIAGTSAAAVLSERTDILRLRGADFNTASGFAPPVANIEPESISLHANGRLRTRAHNTYRGSDPSQHSFCGTFIR